MLRRVVGDTDFFAGLAAYRAAYGDSGATTENFRDVMAATSGVNLDVFFQQWIYGEFYPIYEYSWDAWPAAGGYRVSLRVEQSQTQTGLFTMPLEVRINTTAAARNDQLQGGIDHSLNFVIGPRAPRPAALPGQL